MRPRRNHITSNRKIAASLAAGLLALLPAPVSAEPLRPFCADRPGKDTPPCIVDQGHLVVESSPLTFSNERDAKTYAIGDTLLRYGVSERIELSIGMAPLIVSRVQEEDGDRRILRGVGDLTGAIKLNLRNPDGEGTSLAVQAYVTAPLAKSGLGSGTWEGGLLVPLSFELSDSIGLSLVPEIDLLANENGNGRHVAFTGVVSLSRALNKGLEVSVELWSSAHREPQNKRTEASVDLALAWQPQEQDDLQFDVEIDFGLNRQTPEAEITAGIATRF